MNMKYLKTLILCTLLVCAGAYAAPPFSADPALFNQALPDDLGLTMLPGTETHTVFRPTALTDNFSNGAVMIAFKDYLYCMWQSSAQSEDTSDTWVAYSRSADGVSWTEPMVLAESITNGYCSSGGWWVAGDSLVAYVNVWPSLSPRGGFTHYKTSTDGLAWSDRAPVKMQDGSDLNGIFEQDPHALPDGRMINAVHFQSGLVIAPVYTDDPGGTNGWVRAGFTNLAFTGDVSREIEPSWFLRRDGTVVMTFRDQNGTYFKLASSSADRGENWSLAELTNMRDARTKQSNGNFPNGAAFMAGNPNDDKLRIPLAVTTGGNGDYFDQAFLLRSGGDDLQEVQFPGPGPSTTKKRDGYHYPKSMVWNGYLYVAYTTNKEDVEYTRVPLNAIYPDPTIQLMDVGGGTATLAYETPDFGTYSIESTATLSNVSWSTVVSNQPSGTRTNDVPISGAGQEFFRLKSE